MQEVGILEKINAIYGKLDAIDLAGELFSPETVAAFQELDDLNINLIVEDFKKGNYLGNRKIDIDLSLNNTSTTSVPTYQKVNIILIDGTNLEMPFDNGSGGVLELSSHGDIKNFIVNHDLFTQIEDTEIVLLEAFADTPAMIRLRDADGKASNIERIELFAYSGSVVEAKVSYFWAKTTSALETLANRIGDIIKLGNNFDPMVLLSNKADELVIMQTKLSELMLIHSNLNEILASKYDALAASQSAEFAFQKSLIADAAAALASQKALSASNSATMAADKLSKIQSITVQAQTLAAGQNVQVVYDATTNKFTFSIPQGIKGDRGENFTVNTIGLYSQRALYDNQLGGFSFLALDVVVNGSTIPHIYFKKSNTSGDWTTGIPFGRGEKGDIGDTGVGITSLVKTSGDSSSGSTDIYTMTLTNGNIYNISVYNGLDSDITSADLTALETTLNNNILLKMSIADTVDNLLSADTNKPLSANQGRILKNAIDNINTLLTSDDTTLDEMQEVVNFIKQNKTDLQNLSISNIAGLEDALQNVSVDFLITPTITTPIDLSIDFQGTIISSSFATASNYNGTQDYVQWQAARDINFTDIVAEYSGSSNLTSWTTSLSIPLTKIYLRVRHGSQSHLSKWSNTISVTTINQGINAPTITAPIANATNQLKNVVINSSAFSVFGGLAETHLSSTWEVATDINFTNIISQSLNNTTNKTSWTTGNLSVSTTYYARVKYKTTTYESAYSPTISFTTKAVFTPTIGVQGAKGFGVAPTDEPFALLGLAEMTGTNTEGHDNYGNYIHTNGSIVCWCPKAYYRVGNAASPRYATYSVNALDIVGTDVYTTEAAANAAGYVLPRAFINAGAEKSGFFIDKYMNSKDGTTSSKSVFGGVPISLATTAGYTVSNGMTGCTGILADAVVLSKARGSRWNTVLAFQYAYLAMVSVAQGQAATSTANCAWYDAVGTTNFPKGCNNNALSDVNDTTVTYLTAGDTGNANKPKTGATANFAKTTHNGSMNGVADLNGGMYEVSIGITNAGTTAAATTAIATDTIYTLKTTIDHASLTGGWNTANDVWGDATNLATKYNTVTSPHPLGSATGAVYWGNAANAVFPTDASGVNRDICGFIPKNSTASSATGINMLGNDYLSKDNRNNMTPLCCGNWNFAASSGLFYRHFYYSRSDANNAASFRASAYFA